MRSDGSWLPIIFTLCEDLADLVAIVVCSFDLFNFPDGLPVLLGQLRQGAAVLAGVDARRQHLGQLFELVEPGAPCRDAFHGRHGLTPLSPGL